MEEILRKLQKDASGHKHKAIRDACVYARGECAAAPPGSRPRRGADCVHLLNRCMTRNHDIFRGICQVEDLFKVV